MFISVLNMSLTASYVIVAIMLARLFLKRAPKIVSYALWSVAGFRLVFPFSFESVFSLIPFKSAPIPQPMPPVDSGISMMDNAVSQVLPAATPAASLNPLQVWLTVGSYLWLVGIAVMLIYSVVSIILLKRQLNSSILIEDNIYEADNLKTPFVLGLFRPKIYIPAGLSEEEKRYIILHEQTHIRRHDHVVKFLSYFILCLHWFNPLAWAAFLLMSADMEMSCDERVLKELGGDIKKEYSTSLLSLATGRRLINGSPLAFGEGNIHGRIKNVLNFKKPTAWVTIAAVMLVAVLSVGLAMNRVNDGTGDYDFANFSVNGFVLGADTNKIDTSTLTPTAPLNVSNGYDFNFEEIRYGADVNTGRLRKMLVNVYDGASIPPHNLTNLEQIIEIYGPGKKGWQDRGQRLRYMEYRQEEGRLSATVRFVYTDGEAEGINHRLIWVIAESSLPYPYPVDATKIAVGTPIDEVREILGEPSGQLSGLRGEIYVLEDGNRVIIYYDANGLVERVKAAESAEEVPRLEETRLAPTSPKLSPEQSIGADMVQLDYASNDIVIFHDYFGLFVYDLNSQKIVRSLDLNPIGCTATQGDNYCEVSVSPDGNTVQLHPMSSKNMYVYTVSDNSLRETVYERMENRFTGFVDITDIVDYQKAGNYSHHAVRFDTGEYGYLHTSDWTLGTLAYVRDDMVYRLFDVSL
ncbi:M56 family metallopeptidase [Desulforamulus aquiferis]|uniref:M56 family metallopeptidase n=1 Tax=Desulforamulus aquiferis TaxID=1397668 RepID=A0AAW7ZFI7_9FIRM|nr:M56 family metallopeptidase [Desulforamulus aquiferis]MDO7788163.1 M56 family metallopeptidase [Desulforamulus aquiferis]